MPSLRNAQLLALALILSLLTSVQSTRAQASKDKPVPSPSKPVDTTQQKPDYSQEAVVVEQVSTTYRFERDGTGQREINLRVKVQSEAGVERFGQLQFDYSSDNEKLDMDYVRVRKADGTVVNAAVSDIQDLTAPVAREAPVYTDLKQKHITVPGLRPGDVLEYHMIWNIHTPLAQNHFWLEHYFVTRNLIVLDDELTVNIPAASKVKLKTEPGFDPTIKDENDRRVYFWKHSQLKPESEEDEKEKEAADDDDAESDEAEEFHAHVQLTTFQSWEEVGQWYANLQKDRIVPDDHHRRVA